MVLNAKEKNALNKYIDSVDQEKVLIPISQ